MDQCWAASESLNAKKGTCAPTLRLRRPASASTSAPACLNLGSRVRSVRADPIIAATFVHPPKCALHGHPFIYFCPNVSFFIRKVHHARPFDRCLQQRRKLEPYTRMSSHHHDHHDHHGHHNHRGPKWGLDALVKAKKLWNELQRSVGK